MKRTLFLIVLMPLALAAQLDKLPEALGKLGKQAAVTEIALRTDPADSRVRPFETLVVQVRSYGKDGDKKVRLRRSVTRVKVKDSSGGWVSKPFAFQGKDDEAFFDEGKSSFWNIFNKSSAEYVIKDAVLYTAPEKSGKYKVEADVEGKQASIEIEVRTDAPSRKKAETITFPQQTRPADPYRPLAEHYAPFVAQETWFTPKADIPARFDFDGDWQGDNNWDALETGSSQAYVYYAAMETETHWFLIYNFFHPRDYSDRCVIGTCHENDNEGIILTIAKDGSTYGKLQLMETLAHDNVYSFTADSAIRDGVHNIDGKIEFYQDSHPAIFIESGGHGIYGTRGSASKFTLERGEFQTSTGITLIYKGTAERPRHANDRLVGYDLLPIYDEWWLKAEEGKWNQRTFDDYFRYEPYGDRPGLSFKIGGAFLGRKEAENKAKPFWGWHDTQTLKKRVLARGQWALDPAYSACHDMSFPSGKPYSIDYVYNPYLGIDKRPASSVQATAAMQPSAGTAGGQVDITARIDGTVELYLAGNSGRWEVVSGQAVSGQSVTFSAPLPETAGGKWSLSKLAGRGKAELVEKPTAENGYTAVIHIEDPQGVADTYRLRLQWEK